MNYSQALDLLRTYQVQNPAKYKAKYGDVMPEEAANKLAGTPSAPTGILGVKVEVKPEAPKAVEMEFSKPLEDISPVVPPTPQDIAEKSGQTPKRGRKPKNG